MIFSKRMALAKQFDEWFLSVIKNKNFIPTYEPLTVITWLQMIGMLRDEPTIEDRGVPMTKDMQAQKESYGD